MLLRLLSPPASGSTGGSAASYTQSRSVGVRGGVLSRGTRLSSQLARHHEASQSAARRSDIRKSDGGIHGDVRGDFLGGASTRGRLTTAAFVPSGRTPRRLSSSAAFSAASLHISLGADTGPAARVPSQFLPQQQSRAMTDDVQSPTQ